MVPELSSEHHHPAHMPVSVHPALPGLFPLAHPGSLSPAFLSVQSLQHPDTAALLKWLRLPCLSCLSLLNE